MWVLMVIEGWSSDTPDIKLKLIGRIGEKREDLVGFAGWESSWVVVMGWQGAVLEQHSTILGGMRVSLGLEWQTQRCFCRQGGVTFYPQPISHADPWMLYSRERIDIFLRVAQERW